MSKEPCGCCQCIADLYREAVEKWGREAQLNQLTEECAELIQGVNLLRRGRIHIIEFLEEVADVEIMIGQVRVMFDEKLLEEEKRKKLERLAKLVNG